MGADWRLSWLIACLFWLESVASLLAWVLQTPVHCVLTVTSACNIPCVDILLIPFDVFGGICAARIHGTLGSYLRDALQEGNADAVARLPIPRAWACGGFSSLLFFSF
jgi:hypothetical protein